MERQSRICGVALIVVGSTFVYPNDFEKIERWLAPLRADVELRYFAAVQCSQWMLPDPFANLLPQGAEFWRFMLEGTGANSTRHRLIGITTGRNLIREYALRDTDATHVLFLDSDVEPDPECIPKLLELDHPVVGGDIPAYCLKGPEVPGFAFPIEAHWNCQPLGAKVLTPNGWTTIGEIRIGDAVIDPDGDGPSFVTSVSPSRTEPLWRLTVGDGSSAVATADHLWRVRDGRRRSRLFTTAELAERLYRAPSAALYIDPAQPHDGTAELPFDPYVLGALIGDGGMSGKDCLKFTSSDEAIVNEMQFRLPDGVLIKSDATSYGFRIIDVQASGRGHQNRIMKGLRELGLMGTRSYEKFLPEACFHLTATGRLDLLRGLMDTDGYVSRTGQATFCTTSDRLASDVVTLVRSLGGRTRVGKPHRSTPRRVVRPDGKPVQTHRPWYTVNVTLPAGQNPCLMSRKADRYKHQQIFRGRRVVSVEALNTSEDVRCIGVSAPSRCYVTDDYLVTHNTAGFLLVRRDVLAEVAWRWNPDAGCSDDPCFAADVERAGFGKTYVRKDCVGKHAPLIPVESRR